VPEHCVIESKPESEVHDLRLNNPWPELAAAARAVDLNALDETEHSHVPYGEHCSSLLFILSFLLLLIIG